MELGNAVGIGQNSISRIERDRQNPSIATLEAIADYLGVRFIDLFADYDRSEVEREIEERLAQMSDDQRAAVLAFARMMETSRAS